MRESIGVKVPLAKNTDRHFFAISSMTGAGVIKAKINDHVLNSEGSSSRETENKAKG